MATGPAAQHFWGELKGLYEAAGSPLLSGLVKLGADQQPPIKVGRSTINEWLTGKAVPTPSSKRYFEVLVMYLQPRAEKKAQYQPRSRDWWLEQLGKARSERSANRGGRPRGVRDPVAAPSTSSRKLSLPPADDGTQAAAGAHGKAGATEDAAVRAAIAVENIRAQRDALDRLFEAVDQVLVDNTYEGRLPWVHVPEHYIEFDTAYQLVHRRVHEPLRDIASKVKDSVDRLSEATARLPLLDGGPQLDSLRQAAAVETLAIDKGIGAWMPTTRNAVALDALHRFCDREEMDEAVVRAALENAGQSRGVIGAVLQEARALPEIVTAHREAVKELRKARTGLLTAMQAQDTTAFAQTNHTARRTAYIGLYDAGQSALDDLKHFARLNSRAIGPDDPADPFAEHRDRIRRTAASVRIHGPASLWRCAHHFENWINTVTWKIDTDRDVFYGWRNLGMARRAGGSIQDTAIAARLALLRIYNARSDRDRERAHTAALGPLQNAEAAGLITNAQKQALHLDPMDEGAPSLRPDEKLRPPLQEIKEALEAFAEAAATCLEDSGLTST